MKSFKINENIPKHLEDNFSSHSPFLASLLFGRGLIEKEQIEKFLNPSYETGMYDPYLLKDMEKAVVRFFEAIQAKEKIIIFSDYDCDGIPGAVIFSDLLEKINYSNFEIYIPDRHKEGYGLSMEAVKLFTEKNTSLLVTIDLGIKNEKEILQAETNGINVIVIDHHLPSEEIPRAFAVIDPKRIDDEYPDKMLCGAGLSYKFVQAFLKKYGDFFKINNGWEKWLLDMAGLATLSDMVPLLDENRILAYYGLNVFKKTRRPGLQKLLKKVNIDPNRLTEDDITFMITPKLNAASRLDTAYKSFNVLSTKDESLAGALVDDLMNINENRKISVALAMKEAKKTLEKREDKEIILIGSTSWRPGILGLISSKLTEEYKKPSFVWGLSGDENKPSLKGSCRSDGSVNLVEMMSCLPTDSFLGFGGHVLAGGFSVLQDQVHFLEEKLIEAYRKNKIDLTDTNNFLAVDKQITLLEVNMKNYKDLSRMAPFGAGNPKPVFYFEGLVVESVKQFGKTKEHLELVVLQNGKRIKAITFFAKPEDFGLNIATGSIINMLANFELSIWGGRQELRLRIVDIAIF